MGYPAVSKTPRLLCCDIVVSNVATRVVVLPSEALEGDDVPGESSASLESLSTHPLVSMPLPGSAARSYLQY